MTTLPTAYFAPKHYVQSDLKSCLLTNRQGDRLMALPEHFLLALDESLDAETGRAAALALYTCGTIWGEGFYKRFTEQLETATGTLLTEMELIPYLLAMREYFAVYGFGLLGLDFSQRRQGVVLASLENSIVAANTLKRTTPSCHLEAGILAGWFSRWTGEALTVIQTECQSLGAPRNQFLIAKASRLQPVKAWVQGKMSHHEILERLCP